MAVRLVVVHGETPVEPVAHGTNRQAILAHPGLISDDDLLLAREKSVFLEISGKRGHCLANGHIARRAEKLGAPLLVGSDSHTPDDLFTEQTWKSVAMGAGINEDGWQAIVRNSLALARKLGYELEKMDGRP